MACFGDHPHNMQQCIQCKKTFCVNFYGQCTCDSNTCPNCLGECSKCKKSFCNSCGSNKCEECYDIFCNNCSELDLCNTCKEDQAEIKAERYS